MSGLSLNKLAHWIWFSHMLVLSPLSGSSF
jgi:hypothetical protein